MDKKKFIKRVFITLILGETLKEMVRELKSHGRNLEPIKMVKLSPEQVVKGKEILERLNIKYPLKRDKFGRMCKP